MPDLEGEWHGYVTSSFDDLAEHYPVSLHVRQNWTHMSIILKAGQSESHSLVSALLMDDETILNYQYENVPKAGAKHTGDARP